MVLFSQRDTPPHPDDAIEDEPIEPLCQTDGEHFHLVKKSPKDRVQELEARVSILENIIGNKF